jgi:hypothetical protein
MTEQDQRSQELISRYHREDQDARKTKWDKIWNNYGKRDSMSQSSSRSPDSHLDRLIKVRQSLDTLITHRLTSLEHKLRK